jgi:basic membrane protein A
MRIQTLSRVAALIAAGALIAGCAGSTPSNAGSTITGKTYVHISWSTLGGNPFLQLSNEATIAAAKKYGGTAKSFESTDQASMRSNLEAAVTEHPSIIVLNTYMWNDLATEYATKYTSQEFILLDSCPTGNALKNLHCGVYRPNEASYLIGYEAGLLTKSNKIGTVTALDIPFLHRYDDAWDLGAKAANPSVSASHLYVGGSNPFTDIPRSKELALQHAAAGVDQVNAVGDFGGTFEAAKEKGFDAYGNDFNQCDLAPGHVADSTVKRLDVTVDIISAAIFAGTATPVLSLGLKEGGMDVVSLTSSGATSGCRVMGYPEIITKLKDIKQQIIDGKIVVPDPDPNAA